MLDSKAIETEKEGSFFFSYPGELFCLLSRSTSSSSSSDTSSDGCSFFYMVSAAGVALWLDGKSIFSFGVVL